MTTYHRKTERERAELDTEAKRRFGPLASVRLRPRTRLGPTAYVLEVCGEEVTRFGLRSSLEAVTDDIIRESMIEARDRAANEVDEAREMIQEANATIARVDEWLRVSDRVR